MKKVNLLFLFLALVLLFTGCAAREKPDVVVTAFSTALQKLDYEGMAKCVISSDEVIKEPFEDYDEFSTQLFTYLSTASSKMKFAIEKSEVGDETATVTVKYTYIDATPIIAAALGDYFQQAFAMAFSGADEELLGNLFGSIFTEKVSSVTTNTAETTIDFKCIMTNEGWKISEVPEAVADVFTCNITKAFSSFNESQGSIEDGETEWVYQDVPLGEEVELATIKIRLTKVEESKELKSGFSKITAPNGSIFVFVHAEIENITKTPLDFNNDLSLYDDQGRQYSPYKDAYMYEGNSFSYVELAPNIEQVGALIYNVPEDSKGYYFKVAKRDTNLAYDLLTE